MAVTTLQGNDRDRQTATGARFTVDRFALVSNGMRPREVAELLGPPVRRTTSLAEGLAWPEPEDTCWYYRSTDGREYQICFVDEVVATRGSYLVTGEETR